MGHKDVVVRIYENLKVLSNETQWNMGPERFAESPMVFGCGKIGFDIK
jgi:hypothetical protein